MQCPTRGVHQGMAERASAATALCEAAGIPLIDVGPYLATSAAAGGTKPPGEGAGSAAAGAVTAWRDAMEEIGLAVIVGHGAPARGGRGTSRAQLLSR